MLVRLTSSFRLILSLLKTVSNVTGRVFKWLANQLFGSISWQAPQWASWLAAKITLSLQWFFTNRERGLATILSTLIIVAGGYFGWDWYQHQPKPILTSL